MIPSGKQSTIAEHIARFRSAPPTSREARETTAPQCQDFWWHIPHPSSEQHGEIVSTSSELLRHETSKVAGGGCDEATIPMMAVSGIALFDRSTMGSVSEIEKLEASSPGSSTWIAVPLSGESWHEHRGRQQRHGNLDASLEELAPDATAGRSRSRQSSDVMRGFNRFIGRGRQGTVCTSDFTPPPCQFPRHDTVPEVETDADFRARIHARAQILAHDLEVASDSESNNSAVKTDLDLHTGTWPTLGSEDSDTSSEVGSAISTANVSDSLKMQTQKNLKSSSSSSSNGNPGRDCVKTMQEVMVEHGLGSCHVTVSATLPRRDLDHCRASLSSSTAAEEQVAFHEKPAASVITTKTVSQDELCKATDMQASSLTAFVDGKAATGLRVEQRVAVEDQLEDENTAAGHVCLGQLQLAADIHVLSSEPCAAGGTAAEELAGEQRKTLVLPPVWPPSEAPGPPSSVLPHPQESMTLEETLVDAVTTTLNAICVDEHLFTEEEVSCEAYEGRAAAEELSGELSVAMQKAVGVCSTLRCTNLDKPHAAAVTRTSSLETASGVSSAAAESSGEQKKVLEEKVVAVFTATGYASLGEQHVEDIQASVGEDCALDDTPAAAELSGELQMTAEESPVGVDYTAGCVSPDTLHADTCIQAPRLEAYSEGGIAAEELSRALQVCKTSAKVALSSSADEPRTTGASASCLEINAHTVDVKVDTVPGAEVKMPAEGQLESAARCPPSAESCSGGHEQHADAVVKQSPPLHLGPPSTAHSSQGLNKQRVREQGQHGMHTLASSGVHTSLASMPGLSNEGIGVQTCTSGRSSLSQDFTLLTRLSSELQHLHHVASATAKSNIDASFAMENILAEQIITAMQAPMNSLYMQSAQATTKPSEQLRMSGNLSCQVPSVLKGSRYHAHKQDSEFGPTTVQDVKHAETTASHIAVQPVPSMLPIPKPQGSSGLRAARRVTDTNACHTRRSSYALQCAPGLQGPLPPFLHAGSQQPCQYYQPARQLRCPSVCVAAEVHDRAGTAQNRHSLQDRMEHICGSTGSGHQRGAWLACNDPHLSILQDHGSMDLVRSECSMSRQKSGGANLFLSVAAETSQGAASLLTAMCLGLGWCRD